MNFKAVISDPKTKKAYQKEVEQSASTLLGKKIGHKFSGNIFGLTGYELEITGGSDKQGFPMRRDVDGTARKKILITFPPGFHPKHRGQRKRKSVCGNTISSNIVQVNAKIVGYGQKSVEDLLKVKAKKEEKKEEPKKEEKASEEKKPEPKPAEKKEEKAKEEPKKEEKPAEEKTKEEPKTEEKPEEKKEAPSGESKSVEKPEEKKPEEKKEEKSIEKKKE